MIHKGPFIGPFSFAPFIRAVDRDQGDADLQLDDDGVGQAVVIGKGSG